MIVGFYFASLQFSTSPFRLYLKALPISSKNNLEESLGMGCFYDCFRTRKRRNRRTPATKIPSNAYQIHESNEEAPHVNSFANQETDESPIEESRKNVEEELMLRNPKIVSFDLNVKVCKEEEQKEEPKLDKQTPKEPQFLSSLVSHPHNYRYQNCIYSDDDDEGLKSEETDENDQKSSPRETSDSLFSLSMDSRAQSSLAEMDDKEVTTESVQKVRGESALSPIEHLSHWKAARASSPKHPFCSKPNSNGEITVNTSLSSWLDEWEEPTLVSRAGHDTPAIKKAALLASPEDRPILGALTVEELRQMKAAASPRRSPKWSPDDRPIIGTVGGYWSTQVVDSGSGSSCRGVSNTPSRYGEDQRVRWNSTPFERRLEIALQKGVADF